MGAWRGLKSTFLGISLILLGSLASGQTGASIDPSTPPTTLTCSPAPCVLPNVQVDKLTYGALAFALVANPNNTNEMVLAASDDNCIGGEGFYSTRNGGSTWPGH